MGRGAYLKMTSMKEVPGLVKQLYKLVEKFNQLPNAADRRFTPDGHLVGSLGEVIAAYHYDLRLLPNSAKTHDAETNDGTHRMVQIKLTQAKSIGIHDKPDHLLVLHLSREGKVEEVFNGPGDIAWKCFGKRAASNGQKSASVYRLKKTQADVPPGSRIPTVIAFD
jgi:Family of unknown function (DUF6998)